MGGHEYMNSKTEDTMKDIVTIGSTKIEVDLAGARRVESYRVGDHVKILVKDYAENWESHPGVIVGFDAFEHRPTIVVCYLKSDYSAVGIRFAYIHKDTKDIELTPMLRQELSLNKADILSKLDIELQKKQVEIDELHARRDYFLANFQRHFESETEE